MSRSMIFFIILVLHFFYSSTLGQDYLLNLNPGEICLKGENGEASNSYCKRLDSCPEGRQQIEQSIIPKLCSFDRSHPVICCPPQSYDEKPRENPLNNQTNVQTYSATEMCHQYSELIYSYELKLTLKPPRNKYIKVLNCQEITKLIVGGTKAEGKEFPHMARVGYGDTIEQVIWSCGGSLISNTWVLSAAHCEKNGKALLARWVRLGDLDIENDNDDAEPRNYEIIQRVIYPNYQAPSFYNDIALFKLDRIVEFSAYVRPICLNIDQNLKPQNVVATGWGHIKYGGPSSSHLLKVELNTVPIDQCNINYSYTDYSDTRTKIKLAFGILNESQICAGHTEGGKDTCGGDSGGPIQIKNTNYSCMYTQIGITSFGKLCGEKDAPGVYTKISKYISWIEKNVWPK
ncbi:venom protease-like [Daktulosphaira vitifoliae]|uniref:venom protease-like n=1 Tax=Daktulosphaira vitifoliae TaxID=58002 RepID=UPI0021AA0146|nr:venom protease-like [Daktulosphaira vitifoliae]XP_050546761.1 venom protease-like [Daktulosphaira vitifoliae]